MFAINDVGVIQELINQDLGQTINYFIK